MMRLQNKILLISPSEICHNPRLIKAADCYYEAGYEVVVWNIVQGSADPTLHAEFPKRKPWKIIDYDISKKNKKSQLRWFFVSVTNLFAKFLWNRLRFNTRLNAAYLSKGSIGFKNYFNPDFIHTNVIDLLPLASNIKSTTNAKLIFDAQEFFSGQFESEDPHQWAWVKKMEKRHIKAVDVLITTTQVLAEQLKQKYQLNTLPIRVRNLPFKKHSITPKLANKPLRLIWHGFTIHLYSRGINILLEAVKRCKTNVTLTLQGKISTIEHQNIIKFMGIDKQHMLIFKAPADPEEIVESLFSYNVGLIGEQPLNANQLYTSSNKLFDYIHAGLPVLASNMPGLMETIIEYEVGEIYAASEAQELADKIDHLNRNPAAYEEFAKNAASFASTINWSSDFEKVLKNLDN